MKEEDGIMNLSLLELCPHSVAVPKWEGDTCRVTSSPTWIISTSLLSFHKEEISILLYSVFSDLRGMGGTSVYVLLLLVNE